MDGRLTADQGHVVLDTSALLRWTNQPSDLTPAASGEIVRGLARNGCLVSAISLWEIARKARHGTLAIGIPAAEYARRVAQIDGLTILDVDVSTWLRSVALDWAHRDPADRTIVATAQLHDATLVTSDAAMQAYYPRAVW